MPPPLLIAGLGYVGRVIAEQQLAAGGQAIGLSRSAKPDAPCPVHACDLSSDAEVAALADAIDSPAGIIHCAASGRGGGAEAYRAVYLEGARHLIAAFPGVPLLFTSSTGVYPQTDGSVVTETSPAEPERETARILRQTESLVLENSGMVLRLAGIYGPGRSIHLQRLLDGSAIIEAGERSRWLNQIHRDDAAAAARHLIAIPTAQGEIFNGADDHPLSQRECYQRLAEQLDVPIPPTAETTPSAFGKRGITDKAVNNARLRSSGWRPRYPSFLDAVRDDPELLPSIRTRLASGG